MPSLWIIDAFNLLRQSRDLVEVEASHLEKAKGLLLDRLKTFAERSQERVVCVFDAMGSVNDRRVEEPHGAVKFIYTKAFETADEVIIEMAREKKQAAIVVSSDREITEAAEKAGSSTMKSPEFDQILTHLQRGFSPSKEEEEGFDPKAGTKKRGPSHRRPKKERKIHSKLQKLY